MSHAIHHTDGFILKSLNFGEANKYFFIFTKEFGLIKASAQGVRHLKSKLRYSLEDYSFGTVSLVRGKEFWRITGGEKKTDLKKLLPDNPEKFVLVSRVFSLLLRLLHGEERNDQLFQQLTEGLKFLYDNKLDASMLSNFECLLALRILSSLGYIGNLADFDEFIASPYFTPELLSKMASLRTQAILEINKSLKETQL